MDQAMLWATVVGMIIIPLVGAWFNSMITSKIDESNTAIGKCNSRIDVVEVHAEKKEDEIFAALNGQRDSFENLLEKYVPTNLYQQGMEFHRINSEEKFKSLLLTLTAQYTNLEGRITASDKNTNEKITDLKNLINEKFNHKGI